jgi:serine/threonine-protein kinase
MVAPGAGLGEQDRSRFAAEAQLIAKLHHPNIIQIYEVGEAEGQAFFSLELCSGGNLAERLNGAPWTPSQAAGLIEGLARAMHSAHEASIIHRDLKPSNVLFLSDGTPKVTDFGIAKSLDSLQGQTVTGAMLGTPTFMAPEQAAGRSAEVSPATDVYALGAMLYQLLTGRPPFRGNTVFETVLQVLERLPDRPRAFNPAVNAALEAICLRTLEKRPGDRYQSALALAEDLAAYQRDEPVLAEGTTRLRLVQLLLRESRHTEFMIFWGRIWQWQGAAVFLIFSVTSLMMWLGVDSAGPYAVWWSAGALALNLPIAYRLRNGPSFTQIERQIWEVWCLFGIGCLLIALLWRVLRLNPLALLPMLVLQAAMAIECISVILGGTFRLLAVSCALLAFTLVLFPRTGPILFGCVFGLSLYRIGRKYAREPVEGKTLPGERTLS